MHEDSLAAYQQLAGWLAGQARPGECRIIGINGAQGSGKSTLARFLVEVLKKDHDLRCVVLSLDDCYLSHAERQHLARDHHPLLATRGVPGTHDAWGGMLLLKHLRELGMGQSLAIPKFSKAEDDRLPAADWPTVTGPFNLILFEGWCVGTPPQAAKDLAEPINSLEAEEDPDGRWREYVNQQLAAVYAQWYAMLNALIFLKIPGFEQVAQWRGQQEDETKAQAGHGKGLMSTAQLHRFIQHYERLTRHALNVLPQQADACLELDSQHGVADIYYRN
ncbi:MAG: hypothetical protein R3352_04445 [Salinisphaeraceae bacterium]|nr:hypothetical protein [Salinisphaeraceae bacterium]